MATVNSAEYALAVATPPVNVSPKSKGGRLRFMRATYTQGASNGSIGDVINFCILPVGARLVGHLSKVKFSAGQASATLAVGISGTSAKFLAATSIQSAGTAVCEAADASGATYDTTAETVVLGTNAGAAIVANQVITLDLVYVID